MPLDPRARPALGVPAVLDRLADERPDVDLWWARGGCQPVSNGHIASPAAAAARAGISGAVRKAERTGTRSVRG